MLNVAAIVGRLSADPELRHTASGVAVTSFTLAVDRSYAKAGTERQTDWIDVVAWRSTAEFICKYFTKGLETFDKAYQEGVIDGVFGSNLTYRTEELKNRPWFYEVDVSKYIAYFISALNHDMSVSAMIDPHEKINALLERRRRERSLQQGAQLTFDK